MDVMEAFVDEDIVGGESGKVGGEGGGWGGGREDREVGHRNGWYAEFSGMECVPKEVVRRRGAGGGGKVLDRPCPFRPTELLSDVWRNKPAVQHFPPKSTLDLSLLLLSKAVFLLLSSSENPIALSPNRGELSAAPSS